MRTRPYRLAVVVFDEMDLLDIAGPLEVFSTAGRKWNWRAVKAELVSSRPGLKESRAQLKVGPALSFDACPDPELVLIPGGYGARRALADEELLAYLARAQPGLTLCLSVGLGTLLSAKAGLLRGADVAAPATLAAELLELEPSLRVDARERIASSPRAVTAAQSGAALDLGLEAVARLLGRSQATGTARELGYGWGTETLSIEIKP
jgi:transcriptional regulator GlxA family with amidase domain